MNELLCAIAMIEHGIGVNALTASDSGWDLHCHVPDALIIDASMAGRRSWDLSGRTAHIQVKSSTSDMLTVGTVRGWLTGTAAGVPTFIFGTLRGGQVFSSPSDLDDWLYSAGTAADDASQHRYTYTGRNTQKQTKLGYHRYDKARFPSVLQMWVMYPQLACAFTALTGWMNHDQIAGPDCDGADPRDELIENLAIAVWTEVGYSRDTDDSRFQSSLSALYAAAGYPDADDRAETRLTGGLVFNHTLREEPFSRASVPAAVARMVDSQRPAESAEEVLRCLFELYSSDAARVG